MEFVINQDLLINMSSNKDSTSMVGSLFYQEKDAFSGVHKIANKVIHDMELVFGGAPEATNVRSKLGKTVILYGTVGCSPILEELQQKKRIDLSLITDKREVYLFQVIDSPFDGVEKALVIAGGDKRGTIYGLFYLSELLGVSPLVDWCNVKPQKKETFSLGSNYKYISKEPSIRYRGFFLNDEWPAFGNWTMKNFGGFNATM